jgi:hypothetical protein
METSLHPADTSPPSPSAQGLSVAEVRVLNGSAWGLWHHSAPKAVRRAFSAGNHLAGWTAWRAHLARRRRSLDPDILLAAEGQASSWALPEGLDPAPIPPWLAQLPQLPAECPEADPSLEREILRWLGEKAGGTADARFALEALACGRAIVRLAAALSPDVWWALLDYLLSAVADAHRVDLNRDPLVHQLLGGELPLTLAYLLPEIVPCRRLKSAARRSLSSGLRDLLDGAGLLHGRDLGLLRPLLACWTRCRALGGELKGGCWSEAAESQYEWLVRQALRLSRHDGSQVFSHGSAGTFDRELLAAALRLGGDAEDRKIAALILPAARRQAPKRPDESRLPKPASESEWAAVAVLCPRWDRAGERLTVVYPQRECRLELSCGKDVLWSGPWELDVRIDGRPAKPDSDWEQLCWVSDEEVDFLELEMQFGGGLRVQRHMLLARRDHFLLLADVVLGRGPGRLQYCGRLPLCPGVSFRGAARSWEGFLVGSKRRALVLPLALPEWRAVASHPSAADQLLQTSRGLELRQSAPARRLYAPLFFDLDRRRLTRRVTWRQLTVAESLVIQPREVAVGYRVAVGQRQWLIYRSLAEKANRTLLGHNLSTELLAARFHRSGEVEPLLEIE